MNLCLDKKVVLVTGSSKGIGFAIARMLHAEGCQIFLNGRDSYALQIAVSKLPGSFGIVADVTKSDQADRLVAEVLNIYGRLDGLVCNVGSGRSVPPGEEYLEEWHRIFSLNLWSTTNMVQAASNALVHTNGAVVCISSICGQEVVLGAPVTYSAAKAALNAYVRGISRPLGMKGVRINAVAPGNILFQDSLWAMKLKEDEEAVSKMLERDVALKRLGSPSDIANLVAYLLSSNSRFATGAIWTIDGGQVHT
jgi:3-oxoacyl-[acyl-carrier protein] reductase